MPGSAMERESSVCIRFEQLWAQQRDAEAMATRQQIRSRLVEILNKIQQGSGVDNAPFVATDVSYIAYVNNEGKLEVGGPVPPELMAPFPLGKRAGSQLPT